MHRSLFDPLITARQELLRGDEEVINVETLLNNNVDDDKAASPVKESLKRPRSLDKIPKLTGLEHDAIDQDLAAMRPQSKTPSLSLLLS
jgi:hypothetical protein